MGGKSETRWFESRELGWGGGGFKIKPKQIMEKKPKI